MEIPKLFLGVDIHAETHRVAILTEDLASQSWGWLSLPTLAIHNRRADLEGLARAIDEHGLPPDQVAVALDHTGGHYSAPLVHFLGERGHRLAFIQPKLLNDFRRRWRRGANKDDRADACLMAKFLYLFHHGEEELRISEVAPGLGELTAGLHHLVSQRWNINRLLTQTLNRLHSFYKSIFPEAEEQHFESLARVAQLSPLPSAISQGIPPYIKLTPRVRQHLVELAKETVGVGGERWATVLQELAQQAIEFQAKIKALEIELARAIREHPSHPILDSFPGLGAAGEATLLATFGDIHRFTTRQGFRKALGLAIVHHQSGKNAGTSSLSREGSKDARRVLWLAVFSCIHPRAGENTFSTYYQRKVAQGMKRKKAVVATMGKYVDVLFHCLSVGEPFTRGAREPVNQEASKPVSQETREPGSQ